MRGICIGDDVYCYPQQLFARVEEVFPAAVCVKIGILSIRHQMELLLSPQLWRADDIENLSVCRYCGSRENLSCETGTGIPFRICCDCLVEPMSGCRRAFPEAETNSQELGAAPREERPAVSGQEPELLPREVPEDHEGEASKPQ